MSIKNKKILVAYCYKDLTKKIYIFDKIIFTTRKKISIMNINLIEKG